MSTINRLELRQLSNDINDNLKGYFKFDVPITCPCEIYWDNEPNLTANYNSG